MSRATEEIDLHAWSPPMDWEGSLGALCHYCQRTEGAHTADFDGWVDTAAWKLSEYLFQKESDASGYSDDEMAFEMLRKAIKLLTVAGLDPKTQVPIRGGPVSERLSDPRIEAAAKAAYEWDADKSDSPTWDEYDEGAKGWYREIVKEALAAADAVVPQPAEEAALLKVAADLAAAGGWSLESSMSAVLAASAVKQKADAAEELAEALRFAMPFVDWFNSEAWCDTEEELEATRGRIEKARAALARWDAP